MNAQNDTTSEIGDAIRELAHVVRTEDEIEGIALQVDDLWQRVQAHQTVIDERDMLKRGGAELGRQIERYLTWVLDATGMHHLIDEDGDGDWELVWERLAEMGRARTAQDAQIAAPVPAGQAQATSGGSGASGGLGEPQIVVEFTADTSQFTIGMLRHQVALLKRQLDQANTARTFAQRAAGRERAQVERVRALADELDADLTGIESTQRAAQRIRDAIDGPEHETNDAEEQR